MSTLQELRTEVRELVMERATDTGLIPDDTSLNRWISRANENIWSIGVARNPAAWVSRGTTVSVGSGGIAFTSINASGVHQVKAAWRLGPEGDFRFMRPLEEVNEHLAPDVNLAAVFDPEYRWYVEGNTVRLTPVPAVAQSCQFKYIAPPAALSSNGDTPLGNRYPEHHGLVALRTAQLLYRRDEERKTPWDDAVKEGIDLFVRALQRSQGQTTRRIIRRRAFP